MLERARLTQDLGVLSRRNCIVLLLLLFENVGLELKGGSGVLQKGDWAE